MSRYNKSALIYIRVVTFLFLSSKAVIFQPTFASSFIESYDQNSGLFQATISAMEEDNQGYLLLATQDGLVRFDGLKFKLLRQSNNNLIELASNRIRALQKDQNGIVWIGTAKGLSTYDGVTQKIVRIDSSFDKSISALAVDNENRIWIGTRENGLFSITLPYQNIIKLKDYPAYAREITSLAIDRNGGLLIGSTHGEIFRHEVTSGRFSLPVKSMIDIKEKQTYSLYISTSDHLWVGYSDRAGIDIFDLKSKEISSDNHSTLLNKLKSEKIYVIFNDNQNRLWFGSDSGGGVFRYDQASGVINQFRRSASGEGLSNNIIRSIFQDSSGTMWIGTSSGLSKISPEKENFGHHSSQPENGGLGHPIVTAVFEDSQGTIWVGTYGGGLYKYLDNSGEYLPVPLNTNSAGTKLPQHIISMNQAAKYKLWVGTTDGLYLLDSANNRIEHYDQENKFSNNRVNDIKIDSENKVWIRTDKKVSIFHPETGKFCDLKERLGDVQFLFPYHDSMWVFPHQNKNIFFSINQTSSDCKSMVVEKISIEGLNIFEPLLEDKKGNIWGAVADGTVKIASTLDSFTKFTEADGLPNSVVYGALEDESGHIWFSTNNGLAKLDAEKKLFTNYFREDGLQSNEFNGEASLKRQNGELLFGGINGLNLFDPNSIHINMIEPTVQITNLTIFNNHDQSAKLILEGDKRVISNGMFFSLSGEQYGFEIEFNGLHLFDPQRNRYRYKLEGLDNNWTEVSADKKYARYTNLSPGKYRFFVTASNAHGIWALNPVFVDIEVETPWFLTPWAYIAYAMSTLLMIFMIFRWRTHALRNKNLLLEQTVESRTADIQKQKETIEQQVVDLKALDQAKEHFFENISHEFRTPLALTIGPLKRLYNQSNESSLKQKLEIPIRQASRLLRLINQFLEISRLNSGAIALQCRNYKLSEQIRQIVRTFKDSLDDKKINLTLNLDDDIVMFYDASAMEKIIVNLLSNAINYSETNGQIDLHTRLRKKQHIEIAIKDKGIGISESKQTHVFERFTVENDDADFKRGIGVGLALVKELVELHGGNIKVQSALGEGSCFTIEFPMSSQHAKTDSFDELDDLSPAKLENTLISRKQAGTNKVSKVAEKSTKKWTVLIVDDELDMRIYLRELLQDYNLLLAENGQQGLGIAIDQIPDLIISDVMMPIMSGVELAHSLKEHRNTSHIPIILLTAKGGRDSKLEGLREGIDDYIVKPFDDAELYLRVNNLLIIRQALAKSSDDSFGKTQRTVPLPPNEQAFIAELHRFFNANYSIPELSVDDLADGVNLEKRQLQRKLNALLDTTPSEYLRTFRLQKAADMLLQGKTVSYTYENSGFTGMSHFSRCFKAYFGIPPSQYFEHFYNDRTSLDK